jgi:hypothetical protein
MRTYRGQPRAIEEELAADAQALASNGYYPKSTGFVPGTWGAGPWLLAILLIFVVGLGLIVVIYLVLANQTAR